MDIKVKYSYDDMKEIVASHHLNKFGVAPDGEKWSVSGDYGTFSVINIKKEEVANEEV